MLMITFKSNTNILTAMLKLTTTTNVFNYSAVKKLHITVTQSKKVDMFTMLLESVYSCYYLPFKIRKYTCN